MSKMRARRFQSLEGSISHVLENRFLIYTAVVILLLPVIASVGQFIDTGFLPGKIPLLLFFWPGSGISIHIHLFVWLFMGLVFLSYLAGIIYLIRARSLAKVIMITVFTFIVAGIIRIVIQSITGWKETPISEINGNINEIIISLWHNPIWEEIVFRGIPLLILMIVEKYIEKQRRAVYVMLYMIIPSIACGLYHIPGHGMIRFFDTIFLSIAFSWMALRYTLFAPIVMHYIADAMLVMNLDKLPLKLPGDSWLAVYGNSLNSLFTLLFLLFIIAIPFLLFRYYRKANINNSSHLNQMNNSNQSTVGCQSLLPYGHSKPSLRGKEQI